MAEKEQEKPYGTFQATGRRPNLEDRMQAAEVTTASGLNLTVLLVADGVGGSEYGERAAELAVSTTFNEIQAADVTEPDQLPQVLRQALEQANQTIYEEARQNKKKRGMSTTATVAAIYENRLYLANVGDSRAYLIREGKVRQLTCDHTWAEEMVRSGRLSIEEAMKHPKAEELARSIGFEEKVQVDLGIYGKKSEMEEEAVKRQGLTFKPNDRLLLCSDGLIKMRHNGSGHYVEDAEITKIVTSHAPQKAAELLVGKAIGRNADDNVTAAVWEVPGSKRVFAFPDLPPLAWGGVATAVVVVLFILFAWLLPGDDSEQTVNAITDETAVVTVSGQLAASHNESGRQTPTLEVNSNEIVQVLQTADGARWQVGTSSTSSQFEAIKKDQELPINLDGKELIVKGGTGVTHLRFSDGSEIHLVDQAEIKIGAKTSEEQLIITVNIGRIVIVTNNSDRLSVKNPYGAEVDVTNGIIGINYDSVPYKFEVNCFKGNCTVYSEDQGQNKLQVLQPGQQSIIGGNGDPVPPQDANYIDYNVLSLLGIIPTPTATSTASPTPTPTETATPTHTPRPLPTATSTQTATPPVELLDTDGDGVPDDVDACPEQPGPEDNGGCHGEPSSPPKATDPPDQRG